MSFESLLKTFMPTGVWFGFAAISVAAFAFVAKFLPETKGLSLEKVARRSLPLYISFLVFSQCLAHAFGQHSVSLCRCETRSARTFSPATAVTTSAGRRLPGGGPLKITFC
jgi:hypothetical protein